MEEYHQAGQTLQRIVDLEPHVFEHRVKLALFYDHAQNIERAESHPP